MAANSSSRMEATISVQRRGIARDRDRPAWLLALLGVFPEKLDISEKQGFSLSGESVAKKKKKKKKKRSLATDNEESASAGRKV